MQKLTGDGQKMLDFPAYIGGVFRNILRELGDRVSDLIEPGTTLDDQHLRLNDLGFEIAAKSFGYPSLKALHDAGIESCKWSMLREKQVESGFWLGPCPMQQKAFTLRVKSIVIVYDKERSQLVGMNILHGEERRLIRSEMMDHMTRSVFRLTLPAGAVLATPSANDLGSDAKGVGCLDSLSVSMQTLQTTDKPITVTETKDGNILCQIPWVSGDGSESGVVAILRAPGGVYGTVYDLKMRELDTSTLYFDNRPGTGQGLYQMPCSAEFRGEGAVSYEWVCVEQTPYGKTQLVSLTVPDEVKNAQFYVEGRNSYLSPDYAVREVQNGWFPLNPIQMIKADAVLVKVTREMVESPY